MPNKRQILETLSRTLLLDIARTFELSGLTAKPKDEILGALMGKRSIPANEILGVLKVPDLKDVCREFGLSASLTKKEELIATIIQGETAEPAKVKRKDREPDAEPQTKKNHMPRNNGEGKPIEQYTHDHEERLNNPPVGLVTPQTDKDGAKKKYEYDPHLDPQLQWAGKKEHTSFEVPTVSLHVHERIDPKRIIEQVKKEEKKEAEQTSLFETQERPLREAVEFYKHKDGWTNRLIAGDSLLVMNSMIEKEGLGGKVQMVYFDPPYGIKYGSNFQAFVNKKDVKDGKDDDLSSEPEMVKAFRDTWELGLHSYLTYIRDRLLLAAQLLYESGSIFVQISDENLHHVRELLDEVFGPNNFVALVAFAKTSAFATNLLSRNHDYLLWYAKNKVGCKYRQLYLPRVERTEGGTFNWVEDEKGYCKRISNEEKEDGTLIKGRAFRASDITSSGESEEGSLAFEFEGRKFRPAPGNHWKTSIAGLQKLAKANRIMINGNNLAYKRFESDFPFMVISDVWEDTIIGTFTNKIYVVQTGILAIKRSLLMTTDPGDLVLDITCGSGTTAAVAEQWGRRWITCDTSRVAITLAKQRLMTAGFDFYELAQPSEGIASGFKYKTVPHITLKSIANNEAAPVETLYDQPNVDTKRNRVTGPFTVEAVPAPTVKSFDEVESSDTGASDISVTRTGETLRQSEWREELHRTGVRGKNGQFIRFSRIEPMCGTRYLQAEGETIWSDAGANTVRETPKGWAPQKVLVCFGPEHAPLEQRTVEEAWQEARQFKPDILLFCAFQFDEEAAKDIDEMKPEIAGMQLLKVQMNADLLTDDLRKKRSSNESFWLIGQPEVEIREIKKGADKGRYQVEVHGFDYYNPKTGTVESGGKHQIAVWMLDTDYDNRSLFPSQVFFPMSGGNEGWGNLAKNLRAEIDEEKIEAFRGTVSLPFEVGARKQVAVKIVDDRGIESLKIIRL
jgi:adenine-specific DNA-methyltransferase